MIERDRHPDTQRYTDEWFMAPTVVTPAAHWVALNISLPYTLRSCTTTRPLIWMA